MKYTICTRRAQSFLTQKNNSDFAYDYRGKKMIEIEIFKNKEFGEIRGMMIGDEPYFVAKDIATALGYQAASEMTRMLDDDEKGMQIVHTLGGAQNMGVINESGLYSAILRSKKREAKKFKKWVTKDVLPSIRKHGVYMTDKTIEDVLSDPDTIIRLAQDLKAERERLAFANQRLDKAEKYFHTVKPKIEYANAVLGTDNSETIRDWVNSLKSDYGLKVGERKVIKYLVEKKILYRNDDRRLRAYVDYAEYFSLEPPATVTKHGSKQKMHLRVSSKGAVYLGAFVLEHFSVIPDKLDMFEHSQGRVLIDNMTTLVPWGLGNTSFPDGYEITETIEVK